jgi:polysaccharide export outer membrane protein
MRITRFFLLLCVVALAVAGCARQPVPWNVAARGAAAPALAAVPAPAYAPAPAGVAGPGIDAMVYGSVARRAPAPTPAAEPPPVAGRGLFAAGAAPFVARMPVFAPAAPAAPVIAPAPAAAIAYAPEAADKPYTLDSGDRLRVVVFGQDGLSNSYLVDASGYIAMPLIGSVRARGLTTDQLSSRIADKLRQGYVKEPHVAVEIEAYRPFFILGEVTQPGQYPYVADMTVETAVAIAGGFGPRAFRQTVTVTRTIDGRQVRMKVPVTFPVRPGDTINVQERWF